MDPQSRKRLQAITVRAIALFAVTAVVSVAIVEAVLRSQIGERLDTISQSSYQLLDLQHEIVHGELRTAVSDLRFLARQNELQSYLDTGDPAYKDAVAREYSEMARHKAIYDQIRFLDNDGMEIVRVDFEAGTATVVPDDQLQPKGDRYYFTQTFLLGEDEVYLSPFDLNIEHGIIEEPHKPVIRFGTPVFDNSGQRRGIVILNFLGNALFRALGQAIEATAQKTFLVNRDGYWLWGPDPSVEWGFMYLSTGVHTVDASYPGAWQHLSSVTNGQFRLDSGLFTFATIHPLSELSRSGTSIKHGPIDAEDEYVWKLISFTPAATLQAIEAPVRQTWRIVQGLLVVLSAVVSWFYARIRVVRGEHRAQIEFLAKYDSLTGACNRHHFERSIADEEARARRYRHPISFMMIDITHFKMINDVHGHKTGDDVLKAVAAILQTSVRESDVVVRYGGDEFLIMCPETSDEANGARQRITNAMDDLNADETRFGFPVILAIGSAHWEPTSGETIEDALSHADEQMYEHKRSQHGTMHTSSV